MAYGIVSVARSLEFRSTNDNTATLCKYNAECYENNHRTSRATANSIKYVTISNTVKYLTVALFTHLTNSIYSCLFALTWFTDVKFT